MSRTDMPVSPSPRDEDRAITHTDADSASETRFGPRPVPEGHRRPAGPMESRRVPPSGPVSPDGSRSYPRPSRSAKWLVWGGTALAAAAATAGTVYAARQIGHLIAGDDRDQPTPPRTRTPRPAASPQPRVAATAPQFQRAPEAPQDRPPRGRGFDEDRRRPAGPGPQSRRPPSLMQEIQDNTARLSSSVEGVMQTLGSAMAGFRSVAGQASLIVREFSDAAALVRDILDARPAARRDTADPAASPDHPRQDRAPQGEPASQPQDPRTHRL